MLNCPSLDSPGLNATVNKPMTGSLRKSVTIGACLVFIVMDRRADFYRPGKMSGVPNTS